MKVVGDLHQLLTDKRTQLFALPNARLQLIVDWETLGVNFQELQSAAGLCQRA